MKFSKGTVKNINKKLLAGTLALTLLTTALTGCATIKDINHTTNEQGYVQGIEGTVSYDTIEYCGFYKVKNNITNQEYYTILINGPSDNGKFLNLYDIFTKQNLSVGDFVVEKIDYVFDYLIAFNMVKEEYTEEDLKDVLNKFIEVQENNNNKELVKE